MPDDSGHGRTRHREPAGQAGTTRVTAEATPDAPGSDATDPLVAAIEVVVALQRERDEYLDALQRERAAFVNFRNRTNEEREQLRGYAAEVLLTRVLALADDFDRAILNRPAALADDPWVEGIVAIDRKLRLLLENEGVTPIDAAPGTAFDPRLHEAVTTIPTSRLPEGVVAEELRRGYRLRDRVLRPAMVATAAPIDTSTSTDPSHRN